MIYRVRWWLAGRLFNAVARTLLTHEERLRVVRALRTGDPEERA